jgi:putative transposase
MSSITLRTGLEFNYGQASYTLVKVTHAQEALIENVETGQRYPLTTREVAEMSGCKIDADTAEAVTLTSNSSATNMVDVRSVSPCWASRVQRAVYYATEIRKKVIAEVSGFKVESMIEDLAREIGDPLPPSKRTVSRWLKDWDYSQFLLGSRKSKKPNYTNHPTFSLAIEIINTRYLSRQELALSVVYDFYCVACRELTYLPVSVSTFRRILNAEFDAFEVTSARLGLEEARKRFRMTMKTSGPSRVYEILEIDHTTLDWIVCTDNRGIHLGRPTLAIVKDVKSKYIVAAHVSFLSPSIVTVSKVLKETFFPKDLNRPEYSELTEPWLGYGLPEEIRFDNGLENHSHAIRDLLLSADLNIPVKFCAVRSPWEKPHVESFFSLLSRHMNIAAGRVNKPGAAKTAIDPKSTAVIDLETFKRLLFLWIETCANKNLSERTSTTPRIEFERGLLECPPPRIPLSEGAFDLLATVLTSATLRHDGIRLNSLSYGGEALLNVRKRNGEHLNVQVRYSPENLGEIFVHDPKLKQWVKAQCTDLAYASGLTLYQHKKIQELKKEKVKNANVKYSNQQARVDFFKIVEKETKKGKKAKNAITRQLAILESQPDHEGKISVSQKLSDVTSISVNTQPLIHLDDDFPVESWNEVQD